MSPLYKPVLQGRGDYLINISVPIRDGKDGPVLGLLVGTITWDTFNTWLKNTAIPDGQLVVFNDHGQPLMHKGGADDAPPSVSGSPKYADELAAQLNMRDKGKPEPAAVESFNDPFPGGKQGQLAGYELFDPNPEGAKGDGPLAGCWGVVVEQDKEAVLRPVSELSQSMFNATLYSTLFEAVILSLSILICFRWLMRRMERLAKE